MRAAFALVAQVALNPATPRLVIELGFLLVGADGSFLKRVLDALVVGHALISEWLESAWHPEAKKPQHSASPPWRTPP